MVGPSEVKHFLDHVERARGSVTYRENFPLRRSRVEKSPGGRTFPTAFGLELVEELSVIRIMTYCVIYFAATLSFAVVWWIWKKDMGGAFGAAAVFLTLLTIVSLGMTIIVTRGS